MKTPNFFALVGLFFIAIFLQPTYALHVEEALDEKVPNYVVIGAFAKQTNAVRFTKYAKKDFKLDARFEMNLKRNLYYVYVLSTEDLPAAIKEATRLRTESKFTDTWVYRGSITGDPAIADPVAEDVRPAPEGEMSAVSESSAGQTTPSNTTQSAVAAPSSPVGTSEDEGPPVEEAESATIDDNTEGTKFIFKITRQADAKKVKGDVNIIDVDRSRKMGSFKGNVPVKVPSPASKSGNMTIVCDVFGYRKAQRELNYNDPESGTDIIRDASGAVVVPFDLTRLAKGDIAVMYNVYFFKDASIMRPESRYEVNSLLDMLNENTKYKIKIHGHTNGNSAGKIISMSKESESFFALNDTKEGFGTAKELSEERAIIIRDYLINNGVSADRMQIKAWGGKKPIHDKMSPRAAENVRVEIEILEN
jgi:outer membrane protein OmpA-like peptidoglycan-associated protein